ncbi:hypothetical protein JMJ77_0013469 [Colletotrichum scovillei]|uniref:Uncharacterized protein n=1 Tax=Colletotrichum scovillei TaxID=1209932 RepID=A0A9P7R8S9_9PEZI|nr:hypothetical protein JMJ77_0013469 [Colletotrichum scovillei]KAG7069770.1 hypothetical protein JMJ76_0003433 [Colletotrichum scovillei]KAG7073776.1 hypothetical protein JMJ78_0014743 [Colletotrichum scovillei]
MLPLRTSDTAPFLFLNSNHSNSEWKANKL